MELPLIELTVIELPWLNSRAGKQGFKNLGFLGFFKKP